MKITKILLTIILSIFFITLVSAEVSTHMELLETTDSATIIINKIANL